MYRVLLDNEIIHCPTTNLFLIDPVVTLEENKAGSFVFTMPVDSPKYGQINLYKSRIKVLNGDSEIFIGRPVWIEKDFYGQEKVTCEGQLAYLLDSIQRPAEYHCSIREFLTAILESHNAQVDEDTQIQLGAVTVTDPNDTIYRYTNWEDSLTVINDKLISSLGGRIEIVGQHGSNIRYLEYLKDYNGTSLQTIEFGENLLDFAQNITAEDITTCVIPLGARQEESSIEALDEYLTISSVNDGKDYVMSQDAVNNYGKIYKTVKFDDVTLPENLKKRGEEYLQSSQFANMTLTVTAIDLSIIDDDKFGTIRLGEQVRVISKPHGLNRLFPVTKRTYDLNNPENDKITLGYTDKSFVQQMTNEIKKVKGQMQSYPTYPYINNVAASITGANGGFIKLKSTQDGLTSEMLVMNQDNESTATKSWKWDKNGLGYSNNVPSKSYTTVLDMNGNANLNRLEISNVGSINAKNDTMYIEPGKSGGQTSQVVFRGYNSGETNENCTVEIYGNLKINGVDVTQKLLDL